MTSGEGESSAALPTPLTPALGTRASTPHREHRSAKAPSLAIRSKKGKILPDLPPHLSFVKSPSPRQGVYSNFFYCEFYLIVRGMAVAMLACAAPLLVSPPSPPAGAKAGLLRAVAAHTRSPSAQSRNAVLVRHTAPARLAADSHPSLGARTDLPSPLSRRRLCGSQRRAKSHSPRRWRGVGLSSTPLK